MSAFIEHLDNRFNFSEYYTKRLQFVGRWGEQAKAYHDMCTWLTEAFGPGCDAKTAGYISETPKWAYYRDRNDVFYIYLDGAPLTALLLDLQRCDIKNPLYRRT